MENQRHIEEDEIDVREYIGVIIKRKVLILAIFIAAVVIAVIVSPRPPKIYEITSTIQLGSIDGLLVKNENAKAMILNRNSLTSVINGLKLKTDADALRNDIEISDVKDTNLLKIRVTYPDIDEALKINDAIANPFIAEGQKIYRERLAIFNERLNELETEIKNSEEDIARTQTLISGLPNTGSVSQADISLRIILLQNTLPNYESNLSALRNQRNGLKLMLSDIKDFKVYDAPIKPRQPLEPKKNKNVIIAGVLSLMFGIFLSFVLEFWRKGKERETK